MNRALAGGDTSPLCWAGTML